MSEENWWEKKKKSLAGHGEGGGLEYMVFYMYEFLVVMQNLNMWKNICGKIFL